MIERRSNLRFIHEAAHAVSIRSYLGRQNLQCDFAIEFGVVRQTYFASPTAICVLAAITFGQNTSGLTGTVTDSNAAVVNGATVKLTDNKTGKEQSTTTNEQGNYSFQKLAPGTGYTLTVTAPGFQTLVKTDLALGVGTNKYVAWS